VLTVEAVEEGKGDDYGEVKRVDAATLDSMIEEVKCEEETGSHRIASVLGQADLLVHQPQIQHDVHVVQSQRGKPAGWQLARASSSYMLSHASAPKRIGPEIEVEVKIGFQDLRLLDSSL
jgi:hypothetical protein